MIIEKFSCFSYHAIRLVHIYVMDAGIKTIAGDIYKNIKISIKLKRKAICTGKMILKVK